MSKKHFIALANAFRESKPPEHTTELGFMQWWDDVLAIADACSNANPAFNRERWLGYIKGANGPNGGKV
jgi:hypothetical protein